ncbi:Branched-chain amino acid transporter [Lactobacillus kullabergensis]|uniref:Branched-chain amino acid transporter n=1 Tax=Lactobacillus kullabergensis TaxID=1218493 RepID=A0A0F4LD63_9LACO|nr:AzlD domain-containing protein [Lactobacillus kullabergensis]KJY55466.1 Branched-chain amino acid transporter [Lactobacillus kullabergensis]
MSSSEYILTTIIFCGITTLLSRVIPFVLLKKFTLPPKLVEFLSFVPIVIMAALGFSNLLIANPGHLPQLNMQYALASLPTFISAIISKSLLIIVIVGMISLAVLRLI